MRRTTPWARLKFGFATLTVMIRVFVPGLSIDDHPSITPARETHPTLQADTEALGEEIGVSNVSLYIWEAAVPNMFVVGTASDSHVVASTAAVELFDDEEVRAVIGHELAHAKHAHAISLGTLYVGTALLTLGTCRAVARRRCWRGGLIAGFVVGAVLSTVAFMLTRETERAADLSGSVAVGNEAALASALEKVYTIGVSGDGGDNDGGTVQAPERGPVDRLIATHPSLAERLAYLDSEAHEG